MGSGRNSGRKTVRMPATKFPKIQKKMRQRVGQGKKPVRKPL